MIFLPKALSVILFSFESGVVDSFYVMIEKTIAIFYCNNDGVFIPTKVIDVEEKRR